MDEWSLENVLFGPSYAREHTINAPDPKIQQAIGAVTATVDPTFAYAQFRKRAAGTFFGRLLKSALASAAFYALFFFSMTQPLSALARQFRDPDPAGEVNSPVSVSAVHKQNELGQIADATNDQVVHIQKYFLRLQTTEKELRQLNEELELRTAERT
ncbi:MAG: hypothetical protein VX090_15925 [Pseudomonadota bacterium]|nr:hypothetical protein [Pseudomonadota bacterium]